MGVPNLGFGRQHVVGRRAAWLIEAGAATAAERACALTAAEAGRWVATAQIELTASIEEAVRAREVLVLVERAPLPAFDVAPAVVDLFDLLPVGEGPEVDQAPATDFIEVQVVDARGRPRPSVRYRLLFPDGDQAEGITDADGLLRYDRLGCVGECTLVLPEIDAEAA